MAGQKQNKEQKKGGSQTRLLQELERLAEAIGSGNFAADLDCNGLQDCDAKAAQSINKLLAKYREAVEYDLMKYRLTSDALGIALWDMEIVVADPVNPVNKITWSDEFRHMLGFTDIHDFPDVLHSWSDRIHPDDIDRAFKAFNAHLDDYTGKTPYNIEYRLMMKNGQYRSFQAFGDTLRDEKGTPIRVAGALMDITETKQMQERERKLEMQKEAALAANEAKSRFLASMSHEIRTPMNVILGMSDLLLQEKLNKRQLHYIKDMKTASAALLDIIDDILDISKIQAGKLKLMPVHYYLNTMLDNLASVMSFLVEDKAITFQMTVRNNAPICLYGDDIRLRQILLNLLSNALKFTKEGYVRLTVDVTDTSIFFDVTDTGIGIKAGDIDKLFIDFEQLDTQKNRDKKGTGLGLPISKALAEIMGGGITVESVYGKGTTFLVEIPKVIGDEKQIKHIEENDISFIAPNAKILVVDDNDMNLNVACGLLRLYKISADTASSGKQAIKLLGKREYDLVLMDHMMPEMDGVEATKIVRGMGYSATIIAYTANATLGVKEMLLSAGMDDYLSKPIAKKDLASLLLKWIPGTKIIYEPRETDAPVMPADGGSDKDALFWEQIERIKSFPIATALNRVYGRRDLLKDVLRLLIKELKKSEKNLDVFLDANDMRKFMIDVHGIKGSLANIGAMELAAEANALESASGRGDAGFCASYYPPFKKKIRRLRSELKAAFADAAPKDTPADAPLQPDIPLDLKQAFDRLLDAIDAMDIMLIEREMENIDDLSPGGALIGEIEDIKDMVMMMDYDAASERIRGFLAQEKI